MALLARLARPTLWIGPTVGLALDVSNLSRVVFRYNRINCPRMRKKRSAAVFLINEQVTPKMNRFISHSHCTALLKSACPNWEITVFNKIINWFIRSSCIFMRPVEQPYRQLHTFCIFRGSGENCRICPQGGEVAQFVRVTKIIWPIWPEFPEVWQEKLIFSCHTSGNSGQIVCTRHYSLNTIIAFYSVIEWSNFAVSVWSMTCQATMLSHFT